MCFAFAQHEKLNNRFSFPLKVNLEPFTKEGLARRDAEAKRKEWLDAKKGGDDAKGGGDDAKGQWDWSFSVLNTEV